MALEMHPRFDTASGDAELLCPACGSNYLHHGTVTVFSNYEDQEETTVTEVSAASREEASVTKVTTMQRAGSGTPSSRRDGLLIRFSCEGCHGTFDLGIAQHKGNTQVAWRPVSAKAGVP